MNKRNDIDRLARKFSVQSHCDSDIIYIFLMRCGRALRLNPCKLEWCVSDDYIWLSGHRESYCLFLRALNKNTVNYNQKEWSDGDYELMVLGDLEE